MTFVCCECWQMIYQESATKLTGQDAYICDMCSEELLKALHNDYY